MSARFTVTFYDNMTYEERATIANAFRFVLECAEPLAEPLQNGAGRHTMAVVFSVVNWFDECETYLEKYMLRNPQHAYNKGEQWDNRRPVAPKFKLR